MNVSSFQRCDRIERDRVFAIALSGAFGLAAMTAALPAAGQDEFDEARVFFELNDTDGDLGIHALVDGEAWRRLVISNGAFRINLDVNVRSALRQQGLTEIFFESAEPTFDELHPEDFFDRFPEGDYIILGVTLDRNLLLSRTELTHVMPAPASGIEISGEEVLLDEVDCDDEETIPEIDADEIIISWDPVTMSHPDPNGGGAGVQPAVEVTIVNYELVGEIELEIDGEEFVSTVHILLPPDVTEVTLPAEFVDLGDEIKYEILAREESDNQTAVESCFIVGQDD